MEANRSLRSRDWGEGEGDVHGGHLRTEVKTRDGCFAETVENVVVTIALRGVGEAAVALREPSSPPDEGVSGEWLDLTTELTT